MQKIISKILVSFCLLFGAFLALAPLLPAATPTVSLRTQSHVLILDAGHGGEDGGAVSVSGMPESHINLSIVLKLEQLCGLYGVDVQLTRREDCSLADPDAVTLREKKRSDLKNRVDLVNRTENALLLSIHQNNYTNSRVCGAQVFYGTDPASVPWAEQTQQSLSRCLDQNDTRAAAKIPSSVYLFSHVDCPAVLVECGFLSNPQEEQLLRSEDYQNKLAAAVFAPCLSYLCGEIT